MHTSLVVAIVEADDGKRAVDQLVRLGFTATTIRLGTRFLDAGDSIVLVGCEDTTKCIIEDIIRHTCFARTLPYIPSYTDPILQMPIVPTLSEFSEQREEDGVKIGAGAVFVLEASQITPI